MKPREKRIPSLRAFDKPPYPPYVQYGSLDGHRVMVNLQTGDVRLVMTNHTWIEPAADQLLEFDRLLSLVQEKIWDRFEEKEEVRARWAADDRADTEGKAMASVALRGGP